MDNHAAMQTNASVLVFNSAAINHFLSYAFSGERSFRPVRVPISLLHAPLP